MTAYLTHPAIAEFKVKFPELNLVDDLLHKVILIKRWSLELRRVNSNHIVNSYAGIECRLIVHSFEPKLDIELDLKQYPTGSINLHNDNEIKDAIYTCRDWYIKEGKTKVVFLGGGRKPNKPKFKGKKKFLYRKAAALAAAKNFSTGNDFIDNGKENRK